MKEALENIFGFVAVALVGLLILAAALKAAVWVGGKGIIGCLAVWLICALVWRSP
jgi:hypothetical protein